MINGIFDNVENSQREEAIETLVANSSPRQDFFFMVILSTSMAALGILMDSVIILIGSMLIAPVLYPVLGLAMGAAVLDDDLSLRSAYTLVRSIIVALLFSAFIGQFADHSVVTFSVVEAMLDVGSNGLYFAVAFIAGLAASLSMIKPQMSESFPGVVVSVSLVPPLALAGIAMANMDIGLSSTMLVIFVINILGIMAGSAVVFTLMRFQVKKRFAEKTVESDKKEVEKEEESIQEE